MTITHGYDWIGGAMEIPAGEFKAKCLKLMDQVRRTRREVVITKRGKPVAKLVPVDEKPASLWGSMKGSATLLGDIVAPTGERWDAEN